MSTSKPAAPVVTSHRRAAGNAIRSVRDFVSYRLSVLSRVLDRMSETRLMKASPLALTENRILGLLFDGSVTTVRAVAKEMCLDKAQVSRAMSKLVKQDFASRAIDPVDRRSAEFRITAKGRDYYSGHLARARATQMAMLATLDSDELEKLNSAMSKLMVFAEAHVERAEEESDATPSSARKARTAAE